MAGKWCDEGENRVANILFDATAVENYYIGLYDNATEPAESATMADISEAHTVANGYARKVLTRGDWTVTGSAAAYAQQSFQASGASWGSVTGYFITTDETGTSGKLMAVEQFASGPYTIDDGDIIRVTPSITIS